jgi:hypothetical protein
MIDDILVADIDARHLAGCDAQSAGSEPGAA